MCSWVREYIEAPESSAGGAKEPRPGRQPWVREVTSKPRQGDTGLIGEVQRWRLRVHAISFVPPLRGFSFFSHPTQRSRAGLGSAAPSGLLFRLFCPGRGLAQLV